LVISKIICIFALQLKTITMGTKNIKELVEKTFIGAKYQGDEDTEKELGKLLGGKWRCYDTKIDDGVDDDETEDEYIMVSCFENEQGNVDVLIYYGDVTDEITYTQVRE
jgi:hypothetical protein